ncbi:MAG: DUF456 domain-containing protein [bacterium]
MVLSVIGQIAYYLLLALGVLLTPLGAPGTWLILITGTVYGWATGFQHVTLDLLGWLLVIAVLLEVVEFLLSVKLAQKLGSSREASWAALAGAILGSIIGTPPLPLIGTLVGALVGAFVGAVLWEAVRGKSLEAALRSGVGAFIGRGGAIITKTAGAVTMVIMLLIA